MSDDLPTALGLVLRGERELELRCTDDEGYLIGWRGGGGTAVCEWPIDDAGSEWVADEKVPDNAHWKGWVW
jgi:hypothetical protein